MSYLAKQLSYWRKSAEEVIKTADILFKSNRLDACLFFCHLALEKLLKGLVVQNTNAPAPPLHDLTKLADIAQIALSSKQKQDLRTITIFNIAGRYDDIKLSFYKKCTPSFTKKYSDITKTLVLWLKKSYH
ncbi:MAG: HEPN domain protein [Candidatus Magasanikbacteria bacterium]|nr:HEPN domain protein [Candidatus Magasanikbacteria bacterium]